MFQYRHPVKTDFSNGSHRSDMDINILVRQYLIKLSTSLRWWCFECHSASDGIFGVLLASDDRHGPSSGITAFWFYLQDNCFIFISCARGVFHATISTLDPGSQI